MTANDFVDGFIDGLSWVLQRKDMDSFWPIGFASTMTRYGPSFVSDLELSLSNLDPSAKDYADFPTSFTVVGLGILYGSFSLDWTFERKHALLEKVLTLAANQKQGNLMNTGWQNKLFSDKEANEKTRRSSTVFDRDNQMGIQVCNRLSAVLLAYAEAFCFCNHRIMTEKHGPYASNTEGEMILIRSAKNLRSPPLFWDGIDSIVRLLEVIPESIELCFHSRAYDVKFDMFSNIIHSQDVNASTTRVDLALEPYGTQGGSTDGILFLIHVLEQIIEAVVIAVTERTRESLQEQLIGIMYFGCRNLFAESGGDWKYLWKVAARQQSERTRVCEVPSGPSLLDYWSRGER